MKTFKVKLLFWLDKEKKAFRKIIGLWVFTLFCTFLLTLKAFGILPEVPWAVFFAVMPMAIAIAIMSLKDSIEYFYKTNINKYE